MSKEKFLKEWFPCENDKVCVAVAASPVFIKALVDIAGLKCSSSVRGIDIAGAPSRTVYDLVISRKSHADLQNEYLLSLDPAARETLDQHLAALGYVIPE